MLGCGLGSFLSLLFLTAPRVLAMMSMECIVDEWLMHDDALEMTCFCFAFVMCVKLSWRDWLREVKFFTKDLSAGCPEGMQLFSTYSAGEEINHYTTPDIVARWEL